MLDPRASQAIEMMEKTRKSHYFFWADTTCVRSAVISKNRDSGKLQRFRVLFAFLVFLFFFGFCHLLGGDCVGCGQEWNS